MEISYSYRGVKKVLCTDFAEPKLGLNGSVVFNQRGWSDGNQKIHSVTIQADELLETAKKCLQALHEVAGVEFAVAVSVNGDNYTIL